MTAGYCIDKADLVASDYPGRVTVRSHAAPDSRVSIQPDGTIAARPNGSEIGPWELAYLEGAKLVWKSASYPTGAFALPLSAE